MKIYLPIVRFLLFLLTLFSLSPAFADDYKSRLAVSLTSVSMSIGESVNVLVTNPSGTVKVESSNASIASVAYSSNQATIKGIAAGLAYITIKDRYKSIKIPTTVNPRLSVMPASVTLDIGATATLMASNVSGTLTASSANMGIATVSVSNNLLTVKGNAAGLVNLTVKDSKSTLNVPVTVKAPVSVLTVSPNPATVTVGSTTLLTASNVNGQLEANSSNTAIATVTFTNNTVTLKGVAPGTATIMVKDSKTQVNVTVTVTAATSGLTVSPQQLSVTVGSTANITVTNATGTVTAISSNTSLARVTYANNVATVTGIAATLSGSPVTISIKDSSGTTKTVSVTVLSSSTSSSGYTLLAWNDLGMHCMDGLDFSIFTILPPYNTLHAQLKDKSGTLVTSNVVLTYEAVADTYLPFSPANPSINTTSANKTNFWAWIESMTGLKPAPDIGVNLDGLASGAPAPGNPTPSLTPAPMSYNSKFQWFEAEGIPVTPFDDKGNKNFYPLVKVIAKDLTGKELATAINSLPVSDEMTCKGCHASSTTDPTQVKAKPAAGWVNDPNLEKDWKRNILKLHDEREAGLTSFKDALVKVGYNASGLLATADNGKPVLCVACHASNAYYDKENEKSIMQGIPGIRSFTQALHVKHAKVIDPANPTMTLDDSKNRESCYQCHPGSKTQCLRGAMGKSVDASGDLSMSCQSCHGNMSAVGSASRQGWFNEPTCESCHNSGVTGRRATSGVDANGISLIPTDHTFATNADTPVSGLNLYRFSKGHGGLQCEACHGPTHAEYPSLHDSENQQSIALQGHSGPVAECTACHTTIPNTVNGGPHGMHTTGNAWVSQHEHANKNGTATTPSCAYCHGTTEEGTPLSAIKVTKTINAGEFGTKNWPAGYQVSCFSCHNGPNP